MLRVVNVVGARPNFMKIAPLMDEMRRKPECIQPLLVHTGQHYDDSMNEAFFRDLDIPHPDVNLEIGSGSHGEQTGRVMIALEAFLREVKPDWVVVVGDVNSTMAAALVASKMLVKVAHVEAGLRSYDRTMPEEINRLVTDAVSDLLLTPSRDASENLKREGIAPHKVRLVGNIMIDSLYRNLERARNSQILDRLGLDSEQFCLVTLHRPSNVDDNKTLSGIMEGLKSIARNLPVVFPVHPRTRARLNEFRLIGPGRNHGLLLLEPVAYLDFLCLYDRSSLVLTDSGGVQEETTALGIPCLTLRENTERPITVTEGTNKVIGNKAERIEREAFEVLNREPAAGRIPELWDGKTAGRIVDALLETVPR